MSNSCVNDGWVAGETGAARSGRAGRARDTAACAARAHPRVVEAELDRQHEEVDDEEYAEEGRPSSEVERVGHEQPLVLPEVVSDLLVLLVVDKGHEETRSARVAAKRRPKVSFRLSQTSGADAGTCKT